MVDSTVQQVLVEIKGDAKNLSASAKKATSEVKAVGEESTKSSNHFKSFGSAATQSLKGVGSSSHGAKTGVHGVGEEASKSVGRFHSFGSSAVGSLKSVGNQAKAATKNISDGMKGIGAHAGSVAKGMGVGVLGAVASFAAFSKASMTAFNGVEGNIIKFKSIADNAHWTQGMQEEATKGFGIIGGGAARTAATTAASMGLSGEAFNKLKGPMGDLAVKMGGVSGASEKMGDVSAKVSKAISTGAGASLARYGVVLDDAQNKAFKMGDEQKRTQIISEALKSSVGGLNDKLSQTPSGQMKILSNSVAGVKTSFGASLTCKQRTK